MKLFFSVLFCCFCTHCYGQVFPLPAGCPSSQYLSSSSLQCISCPTNTTQSSDGYSCVCNSGYFYKMNGGGNNIACSPCPSGTVPSSDGWSCVTCVNGITKNACTPCSSTQALIDRDLFGNIINGTCSNCAARYSLVSGTNQCAVCSNFLNTGGSSTCSCPNVANIASTACLANVQTSYTKDFTVTNINTSVTIISGYLSNNMLDNVALCENLIEKGCQALSNMCVMQMYDTRTGGACDYYNRQYVKLTTASIWNNWKYGFPWLYFSSNTLISNIKIPTQYQRLSQLNISLATYDINGLYLGQRDATISGYMQLCKTSVTKLAETFRIGTYFSQSCNLTVSQLLNKTNYPLEFYDPYLLTTVNNVASLYPIPIKIGGVKNSQSIQNNLNSDPSSWALTRRFFLVDNIGGIKNTFAYNITADMITYVSYMRLVVIKQDLTSSDGQIQVPYLEIVYSSVSSSLTSAVVQTSFQVVYLNPDSITTNFNYQLSIAMGILCALAGLYGILRAFFWGRRSGIMGFETIVILKTILHAASAIANVFLVVLFGVSLYFIIFFKGQYYFTIFLVSDDSFFIIYLVIAFGLKLIEIIHIIVSQCSIDIFLIDWERSKNAHVPKQVIDRPRFDYPDDSGDQSINYKIKSDTGVSIWRTYFIANEWNEIQVYRKTSLIFNLLVVLLFMDVIGISNATRQDPTVNYSPTDDTYKAPYYRMFRFAVIVSIFGISAFIQWVITITFYERVIEDKLRNYVDLCSVANVSVFVLAHRQFGYYIHGRSVHGSADISLAQMYIALQKENSGSCAKRGLESDSNQQTYIMALPNEFKNSLYKVYQPHKVQTEADARTDHYLEVNKFLDRFINKTHYPKITFHFQDRKFLEDIFDAEFEDNAVEGRFYRDNGTSFGNVLFYGQELALVTFDILLFTVIDLILQNTVLDAVITWVIVKILKMLRMSFGANNLATKTLVDRRFLI